LHGFGYINDDLQCEFDCKLEDRDYCLDDLRPVVLLRLGTWFGGLNVKKHNPPGQKPDVEKFGYALMLTAHDGRYSRVGIARIPDTKDWWDKGWESARLTLI
jgi:hypothetical protein